MSFEPIPGEGSLGAAQKCRAMVQRGSAVLAPPTASNGAGAAPRSLARRRPLPGSRAVVGGLLVAASAIGLFAAAGAGDDGPAAHYVTVTREVAPGHVFESGDLARTPIELPDDQRAVSFTDPGVLVGNVAMARLLPGELVQSGDVADRESRRGEAHVSVPVEPGHALGGRGLEGELVDVIVTFTSGGAPVTRTVASGVAVVEVVGGEGELGGDGRLTVVLSVEPDDVEALAGAAVSGTITLARTTGLAR